MTYKAGNAVEPFAVFHGDFVDFFHGQIPNLGQCLRHAVESARVVAPAPEGLRGHIGAVGFQYDPVQWDGSGGLHGFPGVFEGQNAGEANVPTPADQPFRHFRRAGIAVEHALDRGKFLHNPHSVLVGLPLVNNHWEVKLRRQRHLGPKGLLLALPWDILVMVVQTDLADGEYFFVLFP